MDMYKRSRGEGFGAEVKRRIMTGTYVLSAGYYDAYYLRAQKVRRLITDDFARAFKQVDVLIGPDLADRRVRHRREGGRSGARCTSTTSTPSARTSPACRRMSVPCGLASGLPVGLQIIGPHFAEAKLLNVAHWYQRETRVAQADSAGYGTGYAAMTWETVIGLEIHAQLATRSKIFSSAPTAYGAAPNTQANLVDLGYPGVLPVLNREAVRMAVKFGLAVGATVARRSVFARKNYFYPDLPKGYQISQYEKPIVAKGRLEIVLDDGAQQDHRHHARASRRGRRQVAARRISRASRAST